MGIGKAILLCVCEGKSSEGMLISPALSPNCRYSIMYANKRKKMISLASMKTKTNVYTEQLYV